MTTLPDIRIPDLQPLRYVERAVALVAAVAAADVEHAVQEAAIAAHDRRVEREERRARPWRPPFRCDECHRYVSSATSVCRGCGHIGGSDDEGQRTSYQRAHKRYQTRKARR